MRILYANAYFCFIKKNNDNKIKIQFSIQIYNLMKNQRIRPVDQNPRSEQKNHSRIRKHTTVLSFSGHAKAEFPFFGSAKAHYRRLDGRVKISSKPPSVTSGSHRPTFFAAIVPCYYITQTTSAGAGHGMGSKKPFSGCIILFGVFRASGVRGAPVQQCSSQSFA